VSPPEPSRRVLARLLALVAGALLLLLVPAVGAAQEDEGPGTTTTSTTTTDPRYPTTSTNVLVTSPPPTVAPPTTVATQTVGRRWPVEIPTGCDEPALPDVVFVGTLQETDYQTGRFRIDQPRAGDVQSLSYQGLIDVRYGIDTKYLVTGRQYLVSASVDPATGVLTSRITEPAPLFGGDEVIGQSESDVDCPVLTDPVRTLLTNGLPVDSGLLRPLEQSRSEVMRSILAPLAIAVAIVFGLAVVRWVLTGIGWGIGAIYRNARATPAVRRFRRTLPRSGQPH
jgi:hypothetical protein